MKSLTGADCGKKHEDKCRGWRGSPAPGQQVEKDKGRSEHNGFDDDQGGKAADGIENREDNLGEPSGIGPRPVGVQAGKYIIVRDAEVAEDIFPSPDLPEGVGVGDLGDGEGKDKEKKYGRIDPPLPTVGPIKRPWLASMRRRGPL